MATLRQLSPGMPTAARGGRSPTSPRVTIHKPASGAAVAASGLAARTDVVRDGLQSAQVGHQPNVVHGRCRVHHCGLLRQGCCEDAAFVGHCAGSPRRDSQSMSARPFVLASRVATANESRTAVQDGPCCGPHNVEHAGAEPSVHRRVEHAPHVHIRVALQKRCEDVCG